MSGKAVFSRFDECLEEHGEALLRLTFLLSRERAAAEELAFQALLRLAVKREDDPAQDRLFLFSQAVRLCSDWFGRKLRRRPGAEDLRDLPFAAAESLPGLLRRPFSHRAAAALAASGFSREEIRSLAGRRAAGVSPTPGELAAAASVRFPPERISLLSDRVYERFSARSVSVENRIHEARIRFDRAAPWLALAVLAFFAFCVWFAGR